MRINKDSIMSKTPGKQEDPDEFTPTPGSGTAQFVNAIPESDKVDDYNYDKLKYEALKEKYDLE